MDRLSSCYFCGDALDASLDDYPVVPADLDPPDDVQRTVVLCRSCHRKLDSVLDAVVRTVEDSYGDSPGGGTAGEGDIESSLDSSGDILRSVTGGEETGETGASGEGDSSGRDATTDGIPTEDPAASGGGTSRDAGPGEERERDDPAGHSGDGAGPLSAEADADVDADTDVGTGTDPDADVGTDTGPVSGEGAAPPGGGDSEGGDSGSQSGGADGDDGSDATLTRLEYNKVMRLLQNREFPVKREGFVNVAANAYGIPHHECEKILDAAIEHGLIDESDGQLVESAE